MAYDLVIKGGRIYDGSGMPSYLGDVAVKDGRIVETGRIGGEAKRVVQADGLAVSPGFIDFHTHLDAQLLWDPLATSSCFHGVTTVMANCASALAPCKEEDRDTILRSFERVEAISLPALRAGVEWGWTTFPQYLDKLRGHLGRQRRRLDGSLRAQAVRDGRCRHGTRRHSHGNPPDERDP